VREERGMSFLNRRWKSPIIVWDEIKVDIISESKILTRLNTFKAD